MYWRSPACLPCCSELVLSSRSQTNVDAASQSWALIFGWVCVGVFLLLGLGLLYSRATNIERPALVGGLTLVGALVSAILMYRVYLQGGPYSWAHTLGIGLLGLVFFGWGRVTDYVLGPTPINREQDEATFGAHLSD